MQCAIKTRIQETSENETNSGTFQKLRNSIAKTITKNAKKKMLFRGEEEDEKGNISFKLAQQ